MEIQEECLMYEPLHPSFGTDANDWQVAIAQRANRWGALLAARIMRSSGKGFEHREGPTKTSIAKGSLHSLRNPPCNSAPVHSACKFRLPYTCPAGPTCRDCSARGWHVNATPEGCTFTFNVRFMFAFIEGLGVYVVYMHAQLRLCVYIYKHVYASLHTNADMAHMSMQSSRFA